MKRRFVFRPGVGFFRVEKFAIGALPWQAVLAGRADMFPTEWVTYLVGPFVSLDAAWPAPHRGAANV